MHNIKVTALTFSQINWDFAVKMFEKTNIPKGFLWEEAVTEGD